MARIIAAADIGSNTAHLLVARTDGTTLTRLVNRSDWLALGEVVARQGKIPPAHVARIVTTLKSFKNSASKALAEGLYVFGTAAMRAASNHAEVVRTIKEKTGVRVRMATSQEETFLCRRGVMLDATTDRPELLLDVGGGSAQIALVEGARIHWDISLPIGTGRVIAAADMRNPCPAEAVARAEDYIGSLLVDCPGMDGAESIVAGGGVGRGVWRAVHPDGERRIQLQEVQYLVWATSRLPGDRIAARFGVGLHRAETLLAGALVYRVLLDRFGASEMVVSEFGVREGAVLEIAEGKIKAQSL